MYFVDILMIPIWLFQIKIKYLLYLSTVEYKYLINNMYNSFIKVYEIEKIAQCLKKDRFEF